MWAMGFLLLASTLATADPPFGDTSVNVDPTGNSFMQADARLGKTGGNVLENTTLELEELEMQMRFEMQDESTGPCSAAGANCKSTKCCTSPGMKCYEKNAYWAGCKSSCTPGPDPYDPPKYRTPWSCRLLGGGSGGGAPAPRPSPRPPSGPAPSGGNYLTGDLGTAKTTRYWDCCKPSCAWPGKAKVSKPVKVCAKDGVRGIGANTKNICGGGGFGGPSYMCNEQSAWYDESKKMSFGFVAGHVKGLTEEDWCCGCYELHFANSALPKMVVQITNTGADLGENHFDIQTAGGGFGIFDGCSKQWGVPASSWGAKYGGVMAAGWGKAGCKRLPPKMVKSCEWHFDYLGDNPRIKSHFRVKCPAEITAKSQCRRDDDGAPPTPPRPQPSPQPSPRPRPEPQPRPPPPQPQPQTMRRRRRSSSVRRRRRRRSSARRRRRRSFRRRRRRRRRRRSSRWRASIANASLSA